MVAIFSAVRRRLPEAKLLVVGSGLWGEEGVLERQAQESGLQDAVTCAGWVEPRDIPKWFNLADVAIYPMDDTLLNRAKCPMKLVDLMTWGLAVVADRVGQVAQYLEHGISGLLVGVGDVELFAQEVACLLRDAETRQRLGARARERALTIFDWGKLIADVERAYGAPAIHVPRPPAQGP